MSVFSVWVSSGVGKQSYHIPSERTERSELYLGALKNSDCRFGVSQTPPFEGGNRVGIPASLLKNREAGCLPELKTRCPIYPASVFGGGIWLGGVVVGFHLPFCHVLPSPY